jgi:hypothetical protein
MEHLLQACDRVPVFAARQAWTGNCRREKPEQPRPAVWRDTTMRRSTRVNVPEHRNEPRVRSSEW